MTKLYGVSCCAIVCVVNCCVDKNDLYDQTMRTVQQSIALSASLFLVLLLLLIVIYDCVGVYDETIITNWYVDQ